MAKKEEALSVPASSSFALLAQPGLAEDTALALRDSAQAGDMSMRLLPQVKIPTGGGLNWMWEDAEGSQSGKELNVILLMVKGREKAWFRDLSSSGTPPSCVSHDGVHGHGVNTLEPATPGQHECAACAWNQWGSKRGPGSKEGKDCKDSALLFFAAEGGALPYLMQVPPTSLKALTKYQMALLNAQVTRPYMVRTKLRLTQMTATGGQKYASLELVSDGRLSADEVKRIEPLVGACEALLPMVRAAASSTNQTE